LSFLYFLELRYDPFIPNSFMFLWRNVEFCHSLFLCVFRWACNFLSLVLFLHWILFIGFACKELSLCPWDEIISIMVYNPFDVLLNSIWVLLRIFMSYVHHENWFIVVTLICCVFIQFVISVILVSWNECGNFLSFLFYGIACGALLLIFL
jgi:hypothetical protein